MKRIVLIALLALVALPSTASAGWKRDRAVAIARIVWNDPCDGNVELRWAPLDGVHSGMISRRCAADANGVRSAQITLATEFVYGPAPEQFAYFCTAVLHEYGHAAGVEHNDNPDSIMNAQPKLDPRCADRGRPYLEAHGILVARKR